MLTLQYLPDELILQIIQYSDSDVTTLQAIRRLARRFCLLATPVLFGNFRLTFTRKSFVALQNIARNSYLRNCVTTLYYDSEFLEESLFAPYRVSSLHLSKQQIRYLNEEQRVSLSVGVVCHWLVNVAYSLRRPRPPLLRWSVVSTLSSETPFTQQDWQDRGCWWAYATRDRLLSPIWRCRETVMSLWH